MLVCPITMDLDQPPQEDSPDITDEAVLKARVTGSVDDLTKLLKTEAGTVIAKVRYDFRRRAPHLYVQVWLNGNPLLIQVDWLKPPDHAKSQRA